MCVCVCVCVYTHSHFCDARNKSVATRGGGMELLTAKGQEGAFRGGGSALFLFGVVVTLVHTFV